MKKSLTLLFALLSFGVSAQRLGNLTPEMSAGRVVDGVEITIDSLPYTKGEFGAFTVLIVPKNAENTDEISMIMAKYFMGKATRPVPLAINQWNVSAFSMIPLNAMNTTLFSNYRVFVGFGVDVKAY